MQARANWSKDVAGQQMKQMMYRELVRSVRVRRGLTLCRKCEQQNDEGESCSLVRAKLVCFYVLENLAEIIKQETCSHL